MGENRLFTLHPDPRPSKFGDESGKTERDGKIGCLFLPPTGQPYPCVPAGSALGTGLGNWEDDRQNRLFLS